MAKSTSTKLFKDEETKKQEVILSEKDTSEEKAPVEENVQEPEANEQPVVETPRDEITDVEIKAVKKQKFRFNGDNNKILELNTSDLSIVTRLNSAYERLTKLMEEVGETLSTLPEEEDTTDESLNNIGDMLKKLDTKMREEVDFIFDAPVSAVLCADGSMYDPIDGMFRYEHIIDKLTELYENNINREFGKMRQRVNSRTSKYTKKFHK